MSDDLSWRLQITFDNPDDLVRMQQRIEAHTQADADALLDEDSLSENGNTLFAYAATPEAIDAARVTIATLLRDEPGTAAICISRWDEQGERWRQVDPPLEGEARELDEALARAAERVETRTLPCVAGRFEREIFENLLTDYARIRSLDCAIAVTRRGLFRERLAFTVTGPAAKLDEFEQYMREQARRTRHIDSGSIPFGQ